MRSLLPLLLLGCASAPPVVFVGAKPPRVLDAAEVDALTQGKPIAVRVEGTYASFAGSGGPTPYCPPVGTPPPVLYLDLPFPVGLAVFPGKKGATLWEHHGSSDELKATISVCPVTGANALHRIEGSHEVRVVVQSGPSDLERTVLIAPEGVALPVPRPDDFDPAGDVPLHDLNQHVAFTPLPWNVFDPGVDALFAVAPKGAIVFTADEPGLVVSRGATSALLLFIDGTTASLPWSSVSASSNPPKFPAQHRLRYQPQPLPPGVVTQTRPSDPRHSISPQPTNDQSRAYLESLRALSRAQAPDLSLEVEPWLAKQGPRSAELGACWASTRCTVPVQYKSGCEHPQPGYACDPGPPIPVYGTTCRPDEPHRSIFEAEAERAKRCGRLEAELLALLTEASQRLADYVARWQADQLARNRAAVLRALSRGQ